MLSPAQLRSLLTSTDNSHREDLPVQFDGWIASVVAGQYRDYDRLLAHRRRWGYCYVGHQPRTTLSFAGRLYRSRGAARTQATKEQRRWGPVGDVAYTYHLDLERGRVDVWSAEGVWMDSTRLEALRSAPGSAMRLAVA